MPDADCQLVRKISLFSKSQIQFEYFHIIITSIPTDPPLYGKLPNCYLYVALLFHIYIPTTFLSYPIMTLNKLLQFINWFRDMKALLYCRRKPYSMLQLCEAKILFISRYCVLILIRKAIQWGNLVNKLKKLTNVTFLLIWIGGNYWIFVRQFVLFSLWWGWCF